MRVQWKTRHQGLVMKCCLTTAANQYLIRRLKRISKRAAWTLTETYEKRDFRPFGYEIGFGRKEVLPPIILTLSGGKRLVLRGKIDRVDNFR